MSLPLYALAPLVSAALYAVAALALKRATRHGTGPWRVCFVTNAVSAFCFGPLWFLQQEGFAWSHDQHAVLAGATFFLGQVLTFLALSRGDVSVATPVLGTKVVLVAVLTVLLTHEPISTPLWGAAVLTVLATALLSSGHRGEGRGVFLRSLLYGFGAAGAFALTDVLVQKWARPWGFTHFAPVMFVTVALCSFSLIPLFHAPLWALPPRTWRWLVPGALLLSLQAAGIAFTIMTYGEATMVNVLYATRGLWTVGAVWVIGHWFDNDERSLGTAVMSQRLLGAGLLVAAVFLVVR